MTIKAIYENGVFRPTEPVNMAERTPVQVIVPEADAAAQRRIYELLRRSYDTGQTDAAARHDEPQP